ncbi:hypothetical protein H5410_027651 [Solanum commersonii]|uniref:Uncharacterized protein n=1 Tax=Solanum commersonii TaxID=4109 RepID=A0A9J5Z2M9_SOLCO|nr:hypothetical protein H5410_027651 [Solanum commersonii]
MGQLTWHWFTCCSQDFAGEDGKWIQGEEDIAKAACDHFQSIFTGENKLINEGAMDCIPRMVNQEQNNNLTAMPTIEELKEVVFSMNPNSVVGSDGMYGYFFQIYWQIIKHDLFGNEIREKKTNTHFNNYTWHKSIPFKASFLLWRTLRGQARIP